MKASGNGETEPANGLAVWLLERLRGRRRRSLPPLALVEAEGRRFLVATSPDGSPAFYPLDGPVGSVMAGRPGATQSARVSW